MSPQLATAHTKPPYLDKPPALLSWLCLPAGNPAEPLTCPPMPCVQAGCWDGTVALFRLGPPPAQGTSPQPPDRGSLAGLEVLSHFTASTDAVRVVAWAPDEDGADGEGPGSSWGALFAVAGHAQQISIWDARCLSSLPLWLMLGAASGEGWQGTASCGQLPAELLAGLQQALLWMAS